MITDYALYLRVVLSLTLVLGLIGIFAFITRKFGGRRFGPKGGRRLSIQEMAPIDQRRRLILVKRDEVEHLILIGGTNDLVIESGIAPAIPDASTSAGAASGTSRDGRSGFSRQLDEVRF